MKKLNLALLSLMALWTIANAQIATDNSLTKLYIATFDRAPDKAGFEYWKSSDLQLEEITQSFFDQPETQEEYPEDMAVEEFIHQVYENILDREADDEWLQYWMDALEAGMPRDIFILAIINGVQWDDVNFLDNKAYIGKLFTTYGLYNDALAKELMDMIHSETSYSDTLKAIYTLNTKMPHLKLDTSTWTQWDMIWAEIDMWIFEDRDIYDISWELNGEDFARSHSVLGGNEYKTYTPKTNTYYDG